jgi:hypothetical protein
MFKPREASWGPFSVCLLVVLGALAAGPAQAQIIRRLTFEETVKEADAIVVATCAEKKTEFRQGLIVTSYKMKPHEFWKGALPLSAKGDFAFEELGGELEKPIAIAQSTPGQARLRAGQQVVLFMRMPDKQADQARLRQTGQQSRLSSDSPRIVGAAQQQGLYSVVKHPESGKQLVVAGSQSGQAGPDKVKKAIETFEKRLAAEPQAAKAAAGKADAPAGEGKDEAPIAPRPFDSLETMREQVKTILARKANQ